MQNKRETIQRYKGQTFLPGLFILFVLLLQGCHSRKISQSEVTEKTGSTKEWLTILQEKELQYETLSARLNVEVSDHQKKISSRVDMRMIKGEIIQFSVQPILGIEVFRLQLTPDSVKLIDRINKVYGVEDYSSIKEKLPVDFNFYNLQALFSNQLFLPGSQYLPRTKYNRFRVTRGAESVNIRTKERSGIQYDFEVKNGYQLVSTQLSEPSGRYMMEWKYMDFRPYEEILFPMNMKIEVMRNDKSQAYMKIRYSRIQHNMTVHSNFNISSRYREVDLYQLLKEVLKKGTKK